MSSLLLKLFAAALLLPQAAQESRPRDCGLPASSRKVDEYGELSPAEELSRLEKLGPALRVEHDDTKAFIIGYAGRNSRAGEAFARADRARKVLTDKSFLYAGRLNTLDCGRRETPSTELWITPVGAAPPPCTPSLGPAAAPSREAPGRGRRPRRRGGRL